MQSIHARTTSPQLSGYSGITIAVNRTRRFAKTLSLIPTAWMLVLRLLGDSVEEDHGRKPWLSSWELTGYSEIEWRGFPQSALHPNQFNGSDFSLALEPEWVKETGSGKGLARFQPFFRWDARDEDRTHWDIREAYWQTSAGNWDLKFGVGKVFWGVAESQHLVDTINQTDAVEDIDGEDKLGQPMVQATWLSHSMGVFDFFYLPYFRERTFPGREGRLRFEPRFHQNRASYESGLKRWHPDMAVRWSHVIGAFDIGLHYFHGTSRDPLPEVRQTPSGNVSLTPFYPLMHQAGLDVQWTQDAWLWKLEAIKRQGKGQSFEALVGGFEYTWTGAFSSASDLGILLEYHFDSRWNRALTPFNHDLFGGLRWALNDPSDTTLLAGVFWDHVHHASAFRVECQRRLGDRYTLALNGQWFTENDPQDMAFAFRNDHFLSLELRRWF